MRNKIYFSIEVKNLFVNYFLKMEENDESDKKYMGKYC